MKRKAFIIGALIAVLCIGFMNDAGAHGRGYRHGYRYRPHRVWIAPPPVVVIGPRYGYRHRHYAPRPRYRGYYGYNSRSYGHRRW